MPIKGISEVVRLPRLGKIRLGVREEGGDGSSYPVPADHFVCPDEVRRVLGEKPRELRVMFPTEDSEQWAGQYLRCYSDSGELVCRGDGETAVARPEGKLTEVPCSPERCPSHQEGRCRRVMNLQFLLPDCPGFGVYQLDTTSFHSMRNVNSALSFVRGVCGRVSMIPLSLRLVEQEVQPDGWPKTVHVLDLTCPLSLAEAQRYAQAPPGRALLPPPPDVEAPDDLFPRRAIRSQRIVAGDSKDDAGKLSELWARAKSKVFHYDIQDSQLAAWFERNFHLTVGLDDFQSVDPPARLTAEVLSRFCDSIDRHFGS